MKKFKFRLAAVLKVAQIKKDEAELQFAEAVQILHAEKQRLEEHQAELSRGMDAYYRLAAQTVTIDTLVNYSTYFDKMRFVIAKQEEAVSSANRVREERLTVLRAAMNKLKSVEQLKEKRFAEFYSEQLIEEQKQLDEIGLQLYTRVGK